MWKREAKVGVRTIQFHFEEEIYEKSFYCAIKPGKG
jgi:hypothetical protein